MNSEPVPERSSLAYVLAVLGAFLIVAGLVWTMRKYSEPPALNAKRAVERANALKEVRAADNDALKNTGWIDQPKGVVRLRIEDAMKIVEREWSRNPGAARSNLISRVEKATAIAPPPPSQFE
jgi:hypothetical protein